MTRNVTFKFGSFTYSPTAETVCSQGRVMIVWTMLFDGREISVQTVRATARQSVVLEVFEAQRQCHINELKARASASQQASASPHAWISTLLPSEVLTLDKDGWRSPTHDELAHVIGIGSLTGIPGERAAELVGHDPQNFRKYTASATAQHRQSISFATWHLLLHRLGITQIPACA